MIVRIVFIVIFAVTLGCGISMAYKAFAKEQAVWNQENKCIAHFVSLGIERVNIIRDDGSCKVK